MIFEESMHPHLPSIGVSTTIVLVHAAAMMPLLFLLVLSAMYQPGSLTVSAYQLRTGHIVTHPSVPVQVVLSTVFTIQTRSHLPLEGWKETNGEWQWVEEDPNYIPPPIITYPTATIDSSSSTSSSTLSSSNIASVTATPKLPSGTYKPKQSLGQNYLKDPNTVAKIIRAFHTDATTFYDTNGKKKKECTLTDADIDYIVELGPGAGALTDPLIAKYGVESMHCIEIDVRSIELLRQKHPQLHVDHLDVLQINYNAIRQRRQTLQQQQQQRTSSTATTAVTIENHHNTANESIHTALSTRINHHHSDHEEHALNVIGNLPYYITSQILFALADATHQGWIRTATITMQYEVGQRMLAHTCTKEYGILSVVFQIYCATILNHFKIPPTVFYPQPKVNSILLGLHFVTPYQLQHERLCGVLPSQLRRVVTTTFQQRRKTIRNSIKSLLQDIYDNNTTQIESIMNSPPLPVPDAIQELAQRDANAFAIQQLLLPHDWSTKRPEEIHPAQFIELTRLIYSGIHPTTHHPNDDYDNDDLDDGNGNVQFDVNLLGTKVWRKLKHGE